MSIENIGSSLIGAFSEAASPVAASALGFSDQLLTEISSVNNKMISAESALHDLAAGKSSNIHHVMLALEDSKLSFQLLTQVRNKLLEGYQDILRMQI